MHSPISLAGLVDELRDVAHVDTRSDLVDDCDITDVFHDSRRVEVASLFCAVPGAAVDGHDFASRALDRGAAALLVEHYVDLDVPQLRVANVREVMPHAAAVVHGRPSSELNVFGITGTNGKTTTTHLLSSILRAAGQQTHVIGTLAGAHTTPESPELQRELRRAVRGGVQVVAAEVSSHALAQHRVDATEFAVAAFSNLTPDHLDYHGTMDRYFAAKRRLFDGRARHELINVDDTWGERLARERAHSVHVSNNDVDTLDVSIAGTRVRWRGLDMVVPIAGAMNVSNALMAAEAARLLGVDDDAIATAMGTADAVPGRMQRVRPTPRSNEPTVIVDYSHTPDSLERALVTIRSVHPDGNVLVVFGCGGDRDAAKRPLMGRVAQQGADRVFVTSDNPRSEDPQSIVDEILIGATDTQRVVSLINRREAIRQALSAATPSDVVLIAGKGHETTQTIGDQVLPFDDVAVAVEMLGEVHT